MKVQSKKNKVQNNIVKLFFVLIGVFCVLVGRYGWVQIAQGEQMMDMAVNTAVRQKSAEVDAAPAGTNARKKIQQNGIAEQLAAFHGHVDAGHILIDDATGSYVEMAYFRIADESGGQSDLSAGSIETPHARHAQQPVKGGRTGKAGGIPRSGRRQAVAVENEKKGGFHYGH